MIDSNIEYALPVIDRVRTMRSLQVFKLSQEAFSPAERVEVAAKLELACRRFQIGVPAWLTAIRKEPK